jgi:hypothetical protein
MKPTDSEFFFDIRVITDSTSFVVIDLLSFLYSLSSILVDHICPEIYPLHIDFPVFSIYFLKIIPNDPLNFCSFSRDVFLISTFIYLSFCLFLR